jgi:DeoR family suf operon transcriptional repressor
VVVAPPVPRARRTILHAVRHFGDATAEEVAAALDITVSGARQQLTALAEQGLVATTAEARQEGQRGRVRHRYHVTELGDAVFPKAYGALTTELLGYLADEDQDVVERLFARRREHRIEAARARLDRFDRFEDKVVELAAVLDEDGYLATAESLGSGRFRVVEHNCAIVEVARRYRQACASEIAFIRAVLPGAQVERVSHIVEGARHCAYEIVAPPAA